MAAPESSPPNPHDNDQLLSLLPRNIEQRMLFRWFFFGVFAFLLWQLLLILSLFADAIIWAGSLTLACQ